LDGLYISKGEEEDRIGWDQYSSFAREENGMGLSISDFDIVIPKFNGRVIRD
jgi:hypothetical protein